MSSSDPNKEIMEKKDGIDICARWESFFIIRSDSDINCYLKTTNLNTGTNIELKPVHPSYQGGKHYLATPDHFYIITTEEYKKVKDLDGEGEIVEYKLHENCRGGDHYFAKRPHFYILFKQRNMYRRVTNMNTDSGAIEFQIHPECRKGLYYWATDKYFYFLEWPEEEKYPRYHRTTNLNKNEDPKTYSLHNSVSSFLPGGLQLHKGSMFGRWEMLDHVINNSNSPTEWKREVKYHSGFKYKEFEKIEHHWGVDITKADKVTFKNIFSSEMRLSINYGGSKESGTEEEWQEYCETSKQLSEVVNPGDELYLWQYVVGMGKEDVLFTNHFKLTSSDDPPTEKP